MLEHVLHDMMTVAQWVTAAALSWLAYWIKETGWPVHHEPGPNPAPRRGSQPEHPSSTDPGRNPDRDWGRRDTTASTQTTYRDDPDLNDLYDRL